jgi:hypothetical protein
LQLIGTEFSVDSPTCAGTDKLQWTGTAFICAADQDTTYTAGTGLDLIGTEFSNTGILTVTGSDTIQVSGGQNPTFAFVDGTADGQLWQWNDGLSEWELVDSDSVGVTYTAGNGLALIGTEFSIDSPTCAGTDKLQWTGSAFICATDQDTTYTAGTGLDLVGTEFVNTGILTISGSDTIQISAGQNPTVAFVDGTSDGQIWQWDATGSEWILGGSFVADVTGSNSGLIRSGSGTLASPYTLAVNAGNGLQLSGGQVLINSPTCAGTDKLQWTGAAFVCAADEDTTYAAGSGLSLVDEEFSVNTGAGITIVGGNVTLDTCSVGGAANYLCIGGNAIGDTLVIGTNDDEDLVFKTNDSARLTIQSDGDLLATGGMTLQGGTLTIGVAGSQAGSLNLTHGVSSFTGTLQIVSLGQDVVYNLPDPNQASVDICLSTGNCIGGGGGAPGDALYLTLALHGGLSNERVLTAGSNISFNDGGANGNLTVNVVDSPTFAGDGTFQGGSLTIGTVEITDIFSANEFEVVVRGGVRAGWGDSAPSDQCRRS